MLASPTGESESESAVDQASYLARPAVTSGSERHDWSFFFGLEGSKQPQDFGVNAHFGARSSFNYGRVLFEDSGVAFQAGTALVATDNAVQVVERVEGTGSRLQSFSTVGFFNRAAGWGEWAVAYDFLWQDYYDDFFLGQWRGQLGVDLTESAQVGVLAMLHGHGDGGRFGAADIYLRPINQASLYFAQTLQSNAIMRGWVGIAEGHGETNAALGDLPRRDEILVFGADLNVPLTDYVSLVGQANFIMPADTGTVDAFLGIEYFPFGGRNSRQAARPLLQPASNATFSVDMLR